MRDREPGCGHEGRLANAEAISCSPGRRIDARPDGVVHFGGAAAPAKRYFYRVRWRSWRSPKLKHSEPDRAGVAVD